jgi:myosin heavy subunit
LYSNEYCRYSILAPNAVPQGFVEGKLVTEKILEALQMDVNEYKIGNTKVFFKAGVLGMLEDMRDERLSKIVSLFQAWIRGYLMRKQYKKLQDQRWVHPNSYLVMRYQDFRFLYIVHIETKRRPNTESFYITFLCDITVKPVSQKAHLRF